MRSFLFLVGSTRTGGNSETLARAAAQLLPTTDEQRWIRLTDHPLPPFEDTRHASGYSPPEGNAKLLCDATLAATDRIIQLANAVAQGQRAFWIAVLSFITESPAARATGGP